MPRRWIACSILLLAFGSGCASHNPHCHGGHLVCEQKPDCAAETTTAPYKATYVLYQWRTPPQDQPVPHTWIAEQEVSEMYVRSLERGDNVGFEKDKDGQWFAVAGSEKIPLEPGRYCWHISEATEYRGVQLAVHEACETIKDTVENIVALPCGVVAAVLLIPFVIVLFPILILFWI